MKLAISLGYEGQGRILGNDKTARPSVGCVIVSPDRYIIGQGRTSNGGKPHAEKNALDMAGYKARGATLYATLEPCFHASANKIPCAQHIVDAGIKRVVGGVTDIHPNVGGQGFDYLRKHGVEVDLCEGDLRQECFHLNRPFFLATAVERPFVGIMISKADLRDLQQSVLKVKTYLPQNSLMDTFDITDPEIPYKDDIREVFKAFATQGITKILFTESSMARVLIGYNLWDESYDTSSFLQIYSNNNQAGKKPFPDQYHHFIS